MKKKSPYPWRYIIPTFIGTTLGGVAMALFLFWLLFIQNYYY